MSVFICCSLHRNPTAPSAPISLSYTLSVAAMHKDSVSVRVVVGGDGPAGRFILPFIYADNPVDSFTGPLVTGLVITDKQGESVGYETQPEYVGPVMSPVVSASAGAVYPLTFSYAVNMGAVFQDSANGRLALAFFDSSAGFLPGSHLFMVPWEATLVDIWRTPRDITLTIETGPDIGLRGVPAATISYRNAYEILFVQLSIGAEPLAQGRDGGQDFTLYGFAGAERSPAQFVDALAVSFATILDEIVPLYGALTPGAYTCGVSITGIRFGGKLFYTRGLILHQHPNTIPTARLSVFKNGEELSMKKSGYLLGFDCGTSSIKAALLDIEKGAVIASATSPKKEMAIIAAKPGWAEQDPAQWWKNVKKAVAEIKAKSRKDLHDVAAVGISYQMHGLVVVDKNRAILRPAIIWCDSRAVPYGQKAFDALGSNTCLQRLLNSPGNFTAAKLAWVKENEPDLFARIHAVMLPGDYIAMMLTGGDIKTTPAGLSEGIMWDFSAHSRADFLLDYFGFSRDIIPDVVPTFSVQGYVGRQAARELGLKAGTPISYRAGDQPNNALSLNVLNPGEIAATAGTSGVVYGVTDKAGYDRQSRVNTFVHVNYSKETPRYGVLLCINGTGILNSWLKHTLATTGAYGIDYPEMNKLAAKAPAGSAGLCILPFGNGAERTLGNRNVGASIHGLDFNIHGKPHLLRAAQEGIVFALNYGLGIMKAMGVDVQTVRAGDANMFLSPLFRSAFATVSGATVELYNTDGSQGAARGAGIGAGIYRDRKDAFRGLKSTRVIEPDTATAEQYKDAYGKWAEILNKFFIRHEEKTI